MHELTPDSARSTSRRGIARLVPRSYLGRASVAVLAALALWGGVSLVAPSARAVTNCTPSAGWGSSRSDLATQVVTLINQHRASLGLRQLAVSSTLTASSQWKSLHMAGYGYFSHDDPAPPVARTAYQRAKDCGYAGSWWGENIAYGYTSAQSVVNGWLGSSGHRANIENPNFSSTGVGVASNASGRLYWTQNFGNDVSGGSTPPPSPPPPSTGDTQKPTTPTGLAVTATAETSVQLRWNASGDNVGVTGYGVYVGSSRTATVAGTSQQKFSQRVYKNAKVVPFNDTAAAVLEVMQGRAAAYMGDSVSNALRAKERPTEMKNLVFPNADTEWNSLNHAVRYEDLDLLAFIDTYLRTMRLRGWYKELAEKWGLPAELASGPK